MVKTRLIAVVIVRDGRVVQSVRFRHTNVIHYDATHAIRAFNGWDVDEIVLLNVSLDPETREPFLDVVATASEHCFVPLSAGGWITDADYAQRLLRAGCDKLVVNTILDSDPDLVTRLSERYGRQCIVASLDAKRTQDDQVRVAVDRGRKRLDQTPIDWALRARDLGAGEIFFNSIDHDGARQGYDLETLEPLCQRMDIPVIAFGGVFQWSDLVKGVQAGASAVAVANQFHYTERAARKAKNDLREAGVHIRQTSVASIHQMEKRADSKSLAHVSIFSR